MTPLQLAERRITHLEAIIADQDETIRQLRREIEIRGSDEVCLALQRFAGLTLQESRVMAMIYAAKGRPVRKVIINDSLPDAHDVPGDRDPKIIDVWVSRIRNKLGYDSIKTIWGGSIAISPEGIAHIERCMNGETVRPPGVPVRRGCLLTINDAREILALKDVVSVRGVCQRYGVGQDAVLDIWSGRRWAGALAALPDEVAA
jgi:hypothetical protein